MTSRVAFLCPLALIAGFPEQERTAISVRSISQWACTAPCR